MLDDDFLKEKQDIREKMLQYSRALKDGKKVQKLDFEEHDIILKRRLAQDKMPLFDEFEQEFENKNKGSIYLKQDLINVKLEERKKFGFFFFDLKKKKKKKKKNQAENKELLKQAYKTEYKSKNTTVKSEKNEENTHKKAQKSEKSQNFEDLNSQKEKIKENTQENNANTKNTLLEGFKEATKEEKNLNFNQLLFAFLLLFFACVVFIPQIYIRNNIYYLSREIGTLRNQENVLSEENKELKRQLENMRFQNQILDYLE